MASITFPSDPTEGQEHEAENGVTYAWRTNRWQVNRSDAGGSGVNPDDPVTWKALQTFLSGIKFGNVKLNENGQNILEWKPADGQPYAYPHFPVFRIYTYYLDDDNYSRVVFDFSYGSFQCQFEHQGTVPGEASDGAALMWFSNIYIRGNLLFIGGNEVDIGSAANPGNRPRNIYVGTAVHAPTIEPEANDDRLVTAEWVKARLAEL